MIQTQSYLSSVINRFEYYKKLGERTLDQLSDKELFYAPHEEINTISIIVNHLHGNMLSRWTDFLTSDGEKEWRQRDAEFEEIIKSRAELLEKWEQGWECLFQALDQINEESIEREVYIRSEAHSVVDAVNRQLAHYAYHVGQMVFMAKLQREDFKSLTIPKGKSEEFNRKAFDKRQD